MILLFITLLLDIIYLIEEFPSTQPITVAFLFIHLASTCFGNMTIFKIQIQTSEITLLTTDPWFLGY
jgi:hypothetical protein